MLLPSQVAIFIDGGFLRKRLRWFYRRKETAHDIVSYCDVILQLGQFGSSELFRIYYYDAVPNLTAKLHCLTGESVNFAVQEWVKASQILIDTLKRRTNFAVRLGSTAFRGWRLNKKTIKKLGEEYQKSKGKEKYSLFADSFEPVIEQKGVDMRIGLDVANIAVKRIVQKIVIVSGDTDMIPAMKLARKEGVRVYIDFFGNSHPELTEHADEVIHPISRDEIKKRSGGEIAG